MSGVQVSASTRALLKAARADAPGEAGRAKIWGEVASAVGVGVTATATAGATGAASRLGGAAGTSVAKLLAMGALLGCTVTVGLTLAVLRIAPGLRIGASHVQTVEESVTRTAVEELSPAMRAGSSALLSMPVTLGASTEASDAPFPAPLAEARLPAAQPAPVQVVHEDPLMREAALLGEARGSLMRGDPTGALAKVRAASRVGSRALEPEELALEARALGALGRDAEAVQVELVLKARYPDHALAR